MSKALSITGFILSLLFWMPIIGFFCSIAALIFGLVTLNKQDSIKCLSIAATVLGAIGIFVGFILVGIALGFAKNLII